MQISIEDHRIYLRNISKYESLKQFRQKYEVLNKFNNNLENKYLNKLHENKLLGGGSGNSKAHIQQKPNLKVEEQNKLRQDRFFDQAQQTNANQFVDFNEQYTKYYTQDEVSEEVLENRIRKIIQALHDECEHIVSLTIRHKVVELMNLIVNYFMIVFQKNDNQSIQVFINGIDQQLKNLKETCFQNRKKYPCLDLFQHFDFLISLNSQRQGLDISNQSAAFKIAQKVLQLAKFGAGFVSISGALNNLSQISPDKIKQSIKEIKEICLQLFKSSSDVVQQASEQYTNYCAGNLSSKIQALWFRKIQVLGDNLLDPHQEIIFYLQEIQEIQNKGSDEIVLFAYMQLNYLLQKQSQSDSLKAFSKKLKDMKQEKLIFYFLDYFQLKTFSTTSFENAKKIFNSIVKSEQFRFLKVQIYLNFSQIIQNFKDKDKIYHQLMMYLCMNYLQEKEISVKIAFKGNQQMKSFIENIEKYYQEIVEESKESIKNMTMIVQDEGEVNKIANTIQTKEEIPKLLAQTYVQMWEVSVKQRQDQNKIAHKDDALLEAIELYIKQKITYQDGSSLFRDQNSNQKINDALKQIVDNFLIPNFVEPKEGTQLLNSDRQHCKILSILADGGSGKSMLLKKLEVELLKGDSEYIKDERAEYIPFIIKCNSLDMKQPSIEKYLESQNMSQKEIELLKKSERNKLIMLDGYDEYAGEYFVVYEKLKINEWVNTIVIVTSRLERITVSDAKTYFNYYDEYKNQVSNESFAILKLEKVTDQDIIDYLKMYKDLQEKNKKEQIEEKHEKFQKLIQYNQQLMELLKLPINLYLITRMVDDLDLDQKDVLKQFEVVSDQVEIQELFFSNQFQKVSELFIEKQQKIQISLKKELIEKVQSCYFEYFQTIAMQMFLQKGIKRNFLSTTKNSISFKLRDELTKYFTQNKIKTEEILQNVKNFIDSRVITRIQLVLFEENQTNQTIKNKSQQNNDYSQEFEFRHKSIFEYFAARAMKYDFDLHKENIYKLDNNLLSQFNINKRIIMSSQKNASEQQILLKFYKLLQVDIDSEQFQSNYSSQNINETNRYIQYLMRSSISDSIQKSLIDIGSSNLLSALFISKFSFPNLIFKKCSFSQAYISSYSKKLADFQECNFENSFIDSQHLEYFETSNTKNAMLSAFQKYFDTDDIYSFNQVLTYQNTLVSITKAGFVNQFQIQPINCKKLKSIKITNSPLQSIDFVNSKNIFVIKAKKTLFEVNAQTLDKTNVYTFSLEITSLTVNNSKYIVSLINGQVFYGDVQSGFTKIEKIKADYCLSFNDFLVTSEKEQVSIYKLSTLQAIKSINDLNCDLKASSFSPDGKLIAISCQENICKIFNVEKDFELITTLEGHENPILSVAFSNDGRYLATGSEDKNCCIWDVQSNFEILYTIEGHDSNIVSVTFSSDNKYLITGSLDNTCKIWEIQKQFQLLSSLEGHTNFIWSISLSANGKYLATGSQDSTCKIWNAQKEFELISIIDGHSQPVLSLAFSSDCKYLATGSKDQTCKIWNTEKQFELVNTIEGFQDSVLSVAFSNDGKYFATTSKDNTCKIWDMKKGFEFLNQIVGHNSYVWTVAFSSDSKYLATGSSDNTCKIWSIEQGFKLQNTLEGHSSWIRSVAFSNDGSYLATGSQDNSCKIWSVQKGFNLLSTLQGHTSYVQSVAFSADCKYLATGSQDNTCKIWILENGFKLLNTIQGHSKAILSVAFSYDSKFLATSSQDCTYKIWNFNKGFEILNRTEGHSNIIFSVDFSNDNQYLVTGSQDNTCKIWNIQQGFQFIKLIEGHTNWIRSVAFSPDSKYLATGSQDITCKIWNSDKGFFLINTLVGHTNSIRSVAFSYDGKYLVTGSEDNLCKVWNVDQGFSLLTNIQGHKSPILSVAFSSNSKYLATGSEDNSCKIWSVEKQFQLLTTLEHHRWIFSVAFSPDCKYLATSSRDNTCKIWNVLDKFQLIKTIDGNEQSIWSVTFSADGKHLAMGLENHTCKIYKLENSFELYNIVQGHKDAILSVAFSAEGKYLATGSRDNTCKIWKEQNQINVNSLKNSLNNQFFYQFYEI